MSRNEVSRSEVRSLDGGLPPITPVPYSPPHMPQDVVRPVSMARVPPDPHPFDLWPGPMPAPGYYAVQTPDAFLYWQIPPGMDADTVASRVSRVYPGCATAVCTVPVDGYGPAGIDPEPAKRPRMTRNYVLHNTLAHLMLVACPPLGEWLHAKIPER